MQAWSFRSGHRKLKVNRLKHRNFLKHTLGEFFFLGFKEVGKAR